MNVENRLEEKTKKSKMEYFSSQSIHCCGTIICNTAFIVVKGIVPVAK
jgi:hypothetical protein